MAEVWLAEQCSLRRQVALKLLKSELAKDEIYLRRFQLEAQAAARLVHANIVQIYDVGCVDGLHFITQEYVPGHNLREHLNRHGPLDIKRALSVLRQVASALHKAAQHEIVHRDIKPDNIMLATSGEVKVADFGLARWSGGGALHLTQDGMTMGTPLYMSPEQVQGLALDPRSDIYSLGVTCYHMLTGQPPFRGDTALSVAVQHLNMRPEPLEVLRPDLPVGLVRLLQQMLAKDPAQRPASAQDILRALRTLRDEGQLPVDEELWELSELPIPLPSPPESSPTRRLAEVMRTETMQVPKLRRARWSSGMLSAVLIVLAFGAGLGLARLARPRPLLAETASSPLVPKQSSAREQYLLAANLDQEQGWTSLLAHWPTEEIYVRRAKQQLARIYLYRTREYRRALEVCHELAQSPDEQRDFRAFGLAGECIALYALHRPDDAAAVLTELWPIREYLDPQIRQDLLDVIGENQRQINNELQKAWRKWRQDQNGDTPP